MFIKNQLESRNFTIQSYSSEDPVVCGYRKTSNDKFSFGLKYIKKTELYSLTINYLDRVQFLKKDYSIDLVQVAKEITQILKNYRVISYNLDLEPDLTQTEIDKLLVGLITPEEELNEVIQEQSPMTSYEIGELISANTEQNVVIDKSSLHFEKLFTQLSEIDIELSYLNHSRLDNLHKKINLVLYGMNND